MVKKIGNGNKKIGLPFLYTMAHYVILCVFGALQICWNSIHALENVMKTGQLGRIEGEE